MSNSSEKPRHDPYKVALVLALIGSIVLGVSLAVNRRYIHDLRYNQDVDFMITTLGDSLRISGMGDGNWKLDT